MNVLSVDIISIFFMNASQQPRMKILPRATTMNGPGNETYKKDAELNWESLDTSAGQIFASPYFTPVKKMLCELSVIL